MIVVKQCDNCITTHSHAYLKFLDEETLQKTLVKLRELGPPREEFNFCRLVRYYEVERAIKVNRGGGVAFGKLWHYGFCGWFDIMWCRITS